MNADPLPNPETRSFASAAEFESWLAEHNGLQEGIWMRISKKGEPVRIDLPRPSPQAAGKPGGQDRGIR